MNILSTEIRLAKWKISFPALLWVILCTVGVILKIRLGENKFNNYMIFKNVFWHTLHQSNLYIEYPNEYFDVNHYGPFFSIIIAPFALLPNNIGCFIWSVANVAFLFYAIRQLPIGYKKQNIILFFTAIEMMTSVENTQFNPSVAAGIILTYLLIRKQKDFWANFFIVAGFLVKLYSIAGIAFFFFSRQKKRFILSFIFWMTLLFCLPMLISSPVFILQSYHDWFNSLVQKNDVNNLSVMTNMSVMGILKHVFNFKNTLLVLIPAMILYILPLLRKNQLKSFDFTLSYLAFVLIGVVIFSSSSESSTYIIAMTGVGIWYILQKQADPFILVLLIFALLLTTLSTTDLTPQYLKVNFIRPYSLKALPCVLVWIVLCYQLLKKDFSVGVSK
ncbi:MAG: DUF2029 domain-containing protein [Bacteroidota bacterium]|nr:DUF2029 domain-containing protein [Bacteroidota bacterium]